MARYGFIIFLTGKASNVKYVLLLFMLIGLIKPVKLKAYMIEFGSIIKVVTMSNYLSKGGQRALD